MTATAIGAYATATTLQALIGGNQTFDGADTTLMGTICDRVNAYIEQTTGRVIAPVSSAAYTLDGDGTDRLYFPAGIRAVTLLEIAESTGGSYATETSTGYVLRPAAHNRMPAWPATWLVLTDAAVQHRVFPQGYDTVRMTATTGFAAIPDDVSNLALVVAMRWWNARQSGYQQVEGFDEQGRPFAARFFQLPEYQTLKAYTLQVNP
jgi:hypothetical protein